jgi:hypothetical protein
MLSDDSGLDVALIKLCKRLVSTFLVKKKDALFNGLSLTDAILPSFNVS